MRPYRVRRRHPAISAVAGLLALATVVTLTGAPAAPVRAAPAAALQFTTTLAAETGNNTSTSPGFTGIVNGVANGNIRPGNISNVPTRSLLYPGATTPIYAHMAPWFGQHTYKGVAYPWVDHPDVGYRSDDPAQVEKQVQDMRRRGIDGIIVDWYGDPAIEEAAGCVPHALEDNATKAIRDRSQTQDGAFKFAVMFDGNVLQWCKPSNPTAFAMRELEYAFSNYVASSAYARLDGRPVIFGFDTGRCLAPPPNSTECATDAQYRAVDWEQVRQSGKFGNALFVEVNAGALTARGLDGAYSWVYARDFQPKENWGQVDIASFFQVADSNLGRLAVGGVYKGFDGRPTPPAWSGNKLMEQDCGQVWLKTFAEINAHRGGSHVPLPMLQIVTWNDYEEGTSLETGIDNCVTISATTSGQRLTWSIIGEQNTIDHYTVFASQDGQSLAVLLDDVPASQRGVDLAPFGLGAGSYSLYVKAVGKPSLLNHMSEVTPYAEQGVRPGVFIERDGQLVLAGEHAHLTINRAGHGWVPDSDRPGFASGVAMLAAPERDLKIESGYASGSPELQFRGHFNTTGTFYVWVRGLGDGPTSDSVHVGIDGGGSATADHMTLVDTEPYGVWRWFRGRMDNRPIATLTVSEVGIHVISVWMREDGFRLDRVLLTTNAALRPDGSGPAESARGAALPNGSCPIFAGTATTPIADSGCKLERGPMVADRIPTAWKAYYDSGQGAVWALAGQVIHTPEATFYRAPSESHAPVTQTGSGHIKGAITSRCGSLLRLEVTRIDNALVDIRDRTNQSVPFVVELPDRPKQVDVFVTRLDRSLSATARLMVRDECGDWPTFIGLGTRVS